ncbi:unnamed protein product [Phaeothamnion confervicola]
MLSQRPFDDGVGGEALRAAADAATAKARLAEPRQCSTWRLPDKAVGRYVRVQIEGFDYLHLAQVEVFGTFGARRSPGRVSYVACGRYVTVAVLRPLPDPADVAAAYRRAVAADPLNAEVLRQLETFVPEWDKWGRGDAFRGCALCTGGRLCELCALRHDFRDDLMKLPLGPGGRLRRLDSVARFLYDTEKPGLEADNKFTRGGSGGDENDGSDSSSDEEEGEKPAGVLRKRRGSGGEKDDSKDVKGGKGSKINSGSKRGLLGMLRGRHRRSNGRGKNGEAAAAGKDGDGDGRTSGGEDDGADGQGSRAGGAGADAGRPVEGGDGSDSDESTRSISEGSGDRSGGGGAASGGRNGSGGRKGGADARGARRRGKKKSVTPGG